MRKKINFTILQNDEVPEDKNVVIFREVGKPLVILNKKEVDLLVKAWTKESE